VAGDYAYSTIRTGNGCGGTLNQLDIIDVRTMESPSLVKSISLNSPYGLGVDGSRLFICDGIAGLKMFDRTDPENIYLLQIVQTGLTYDVIPVDGLLILVSQGALIQYDYSGGSMVELSRMEVGQ